ncbi:extradiol dioxygenase [Erythrobacter sp. KY5]|uniref:VOC family protein n=1 Tax=Erythrobacter sp. KY5 TaxID=2011159 RepID=UPI000DBEF59B|nr:VOC family protein [Erythrobacter sp. KY5]AWW75740.1 extradiol dioxygenase [Erythrobacter sp. KY5]
MTTLTLSTITLVVPDYDAGIEFYRDRIGFELVEDTDLGNGKRWVVVAPDCGGHLLLAKAMGAEQRAAIGNQTGGRVAFFLETDSFTETYDRFARAGVKFLEQPREEPYGKVVVFSDPFGNRWDLIEPKAAE